MKFNQIMAIVAALFLAIFSGGIARTQANMQYTQVFEVVEVNDNLVCLTDCDGNEWIWEGAESWEVGEFAAATMNTNGTDDIYDDIIVNLRYTKIAAR